MTLKYKPNIGTNEMNVAFFFIQWGKGCNNQLCYYKLIWAFPSAMENSVAAIFAS